MGLEGEDGLRLMTALLDSVFDLAAIADLDGRLQYLNAAGRKLLGVEAPEGTVQELLGLDLVEEQGWVEVTIPRAAGPVEAVLSNFLLRDADGQPFGWGV